MNELEFSEVFSDSKTDRDIHLGEITADSAWLLIQKWREAASLCSFRMRKAMEAKEPPMRWEMDSLAASRDAFRTCAGELELCARIKATNESPQQLWIIQERHIQSDEWYDSPHCKPFFNRECAEEYCQRESACHNAYAYRVVPKAKSAVQKLLADWEQDSEWHRKRAKDYANRCGGAPQWIAEAAADMLLECLKELKDAVNTDRAC